MKGQKEFLPSFSFVSTSTCAFAFHICLSLSFSKLWHSCDILFSSLLETKGVLHIFLDYSPSAPQKYIFETGEHQRSKWLTGLSGAVRWYRLEALLHTYFISLVMFPTISCRGERHQRFQDWKLFTQVVLAYFLQDSYTI